jgi:Zn-dependent protease with chaperone function
MQPTMSQQSLASPPSAATIAGDASHLLAHISAEMKPVRPSTAYIGAMLLAMTTALLALAIYLAVVLAVGWGIYAWIISIKSQFSALQAVGVLMSLPILIALVKPVMLPKQEEHEPVELTEFSQPMLHNYVAALAKKLGAPRPARIFTDSSVNAYAAPRPVLFGLLGIRYDLCVGMALFEGLTAREVTGVIAHELGHFGQGGAVRISLASRAIAYWLWKIAYVRDIFDYQLWRLTQAQDGYIAFIASIALLPSEIVRLLAAALVHMVAAGDSLLARQMEHDADKYETRVAGSAASERITSRLLELEMAQGTAFGRTSLWLAKGRVPDDMIKVLVRSARQLAPEQLTKRVKLGVGARSSVFASHPTGRERIDRARAENEPGICTLDAPGTALLMSPHLVSEEVTRQLVREKLGPRAHRQITFVPVAEFLSAYDKTDRAIDALRAILGDDVAHTLTIEPVFLSTSEVSAADEPAATRQRMAQAKAAIKAARPAAQQPAKRVRAADLVIEQATQAQMLLRIHCKINASDFGLDRASLPEADERIHLARTEISDASGAVEPLTKALRTYILCALQLACSRKLDAVIPGRAALATEIKKLVELNGALRQAWPSTSQLQSTRTSLEALATQLSGREPGELVRKQLDALLKPTDELINHIESHTHQLADPFHSTTTEYRSLWHTLVPTGMSDHHPDEDFGVVLADWLNVISVLLDEHHAIARRLLVRLIEIAAQVEKATANPTA